MGTEQMFPAHKCGLYLTHNEHKDIYLTAKQAIEEEEERNHSVNWENEEMKKKAIETDEIWELQWYPNTPIGFFVIWAPTLDDLLRFAKKVENNE